MPTEGGVGAGAVAPKPSGGVTGDVSLRVFGEPMLSTANGWVRINGNSGRVLCALAATRAGMSIDHLTEMLWPQGHPRTARSALHVHLARLRKLLDDATESSGGIAVMRRGNMYALDSANGVVDVDLFESLRRRARPLVRVSPEEAEELIARALELSHQPAFAVGGESVNPAATDQLLLARLDLEEQHAEALLGARRLADAERLAMDLVADEPFREVRWGLLIRAQAMQANRANALATFRRARVELVNGLGIEPGEELQRLQLAVLADDVSALGAAAAPADLVGELPPPSLVPLIGRAEELLWAEQVLASRAPLVLLGAPGVGKTRLAAEIGFRAAENTDVNWLDLSGAAFSNPTALDDAVRWARRHPGGLLIIDNAETDTEWAATVMVAIRRVAPRLQVVVTSRVPLGGETATYVVQPLAVSNATVERGESHDADGNEPDAGDVDGSVDGPAVQLLRALLALRAPAAAIDNSMAVALVSAVGGLPLGIRLVADLARAVPADALAARSAALVADELGPSVEAVLAEFAPEVGEALAAVSVVPGHLDRPLVDALAGADAGSAIGVLIDAGLVQFDVSRPEAPYSILEPIREVASAMLDRSGRRNAVLDALVDECIRRARGVDLPAPPEKLAAVIARLTDDLPLHRQAMAHLAAHGRDITALRLAGGLEAPLYLAGQWAAATELQSAALAIDGEPSSVRALVHVMRGRPGPLHCMDVGHQTIARDMALQLGDAGTCARATCYLALTAWWEGDDARAIGLYEEAARLAAEAKIVFVEIDIERFMGVAMVTAGNFDGGFRAQLRALDRAETTPGMEALVPHMLMYLGHCRRATGDTEAAEVTLDRSRVAFEKASNMASLIHVYAGLAELAADRGDGPAARRLAARGMELAARGGSFDYDGWLACTLARASASEGDVASARAAAVEAVAGVARGWVGETHRVAAELAAVAHQLGDAPAAARLIGLADATPDRRELPFTTPAERERFRDARSWASDRLGERADSEVARGASSTLSEAAARLLTLPSA